MKETVASLLTSTYFIGDSTSLGVKGDGESETLTLNQLPIGITAAGSSSVTVSFGHSVATYFTPSINPRTPTSGGVASAYDASGAGSLTFITSASGSGSASVTSNNTGGAAHAIVQPTNICNYIIRII